MIPFFGHTFNEDAWVPKAEASYFHVGQKIGYVPSEAWVSSFIGHDDNFGPNFCVPRFYVKPENVQYVAAIYPQQMLYDGVIAEAVASAYLYSLLPRLSHSRNKWLARLVSYAGVSQQVVLRALALRRSEYVAHLRRVKDWRYQREYPRICTVLDRHLPGKLWMVEVSIPELFPANLRKLGEIVLDATVKASSALDFKTFLFARLPGQFLFYKGRARDKRPDFLSIPSRIKSHTPVRCKETENGFPGSPP